MNRYLIADTGNGKLASVLESLRGDPTCVVVDVMGPAGRPDTIVVEMTDKRAAEINQQFGGGLVVERDAAVEPSAPPVSRPAGRDRLR
jgi:hypothetical protein